MFLNQDVSLFSPQTLSQTAHKALLIQFLLFEILEGYKSCYMQQGQTSALLSAHPRFFPYDWSANIGYLNKAQEHALFLRKSFPKALGAVSGFEKTLCKEMKSLSKNKGKIKESLKNLYLSLEPLILLCKEDENLLFFLLKNKAVIDALTSCGYLKELLDRIYPCGREMLGEKMCDKYHQRGFFSQIPEFKLLLSEL